jgi:hypothetical protein
MRSRILISLCLAVSIGGALAAQSSPKELARKVLPSIALLVLQDENGHPVSLGSGVLVRSNILVTSFHVIEGASAGFASLAGRTNRLQITGVVSFDTERDLAAIEITNFYAAPLPIGNSENVSIGDTVFSVGNPRGFEGTFAHGIVSGIRSIGDDTLFQITAPISPGSSGGAIINDSGELVGIAFATFNGGQNLNFAVPSSYVVRLLAGIGKPVPLKSNRPTLSRKSVFTGIGSTTVEGVEVSNFMWTSGTPDGQANNFAISLSNRLKEPIRNVEVLVIFKDANGNPIDVSTVECDETIPPGLARRTKGRADDDVKTMAEAANVREAERAKQNAHIVRLKIEIESLDKQLLTLDSEISTLAAKVAETKKKLAASEGDRESLLKNWRHLESEEQNRIREYTDLKARRVAAARLQDDYLNSNRADAIQKDQDGTNLNAQNSRIAINIEYRVLGFTIAD